MGPHQPRHICFSVPHRHLSLQTVMITIARAMEKLFAPVDRDTGFQHRSGPTTRVAYGNRRSAHLLLTEHHTGPGQART